MAGFNNREQFLASEPEMDMAQFRHVELDLRYADQSENQILAIIYLDEGDEPYPLVTCLTAAHLPWGIKGSITSNQCISL